jgi:hypothetical protein
MTDYKEYLNSHKIQFVEKRSVDELRIDLQDLIQDRDDLKGLKGVNRVIVRNMMINLNTNLKYHTKLCNILDEEHIDDIDLCINQLLSEI